MTVMAPVWDALPTVIIVKPGLNMALPMFELVGAAPLVVAPSHNTLGRFRVWLAMPIPIVVEAVCGAMLKVPPTL